MKLAVITGGGRGIGAAISERLAADGYRILLTYNNDSQSAESVISKLRQDSVDCVAVKVDCGHLMRCSSLLTIHGCKMV